MINGVFVRTSERINGCPTFVKAGLDVWWFYGSNEHWYLGNASNKSQRLRGFVSSVQCGIRNLTDPRLRWRADNPERDTWVLEPEVRITPLQDLSLESLQALKLPVIHTCNFDKYLSKTKAIQAINLLFVNFAYIPGRSD